MSTPLLSKKQQRQIGTSIEAFIRIGVLVGIAVICVDLLKPFLIPVLWGAIIAVALYPLFLKVRGWLGGRNGLAATLISLVLISFIVGPSIPLSSSMIDAVGELTGAVESGDLKVPPPPAGVADWPVIGNQAYEIWSQASNNLEAFVQAFEPQIISAVTAFLGLVASGGAAVLFTIISLAIAGAFLATADVCVKGLTAFVTRLGGDSGREFVTTSALVVKSVATGVIGVAVIQAFLAAVGMAFVGVPFTALWALLILILAIAQIPALLVLGPVIAWVFTSSDGVTATIFAVYVVVVAMSDGFLKPLLLGRGVSIPTLVILLGAIGGMMLMGIIGLFIGAVILALGWELLVSWVQGEVDEPELETAD
ncbi:AI-2E family transporter [Bacteroidota bacterium]